MLTKSMRHLRSIREAFLAETFIASEASFPLDF